MKKLRLLAVTVLIAGIAASALMLTACPSTPGNGWPQNSLTRLLPPKPANFKVVGSTSTSTSWGCDLIETGVTLEDVHAYVDALKARGFTSGTREGTDDFGYSFSAKNRDGYEVGIRFLAGDSFYLDISLNK